MTASLTTPVVTPVVGAVPDVDDDVVALTRRLVVAEDAAWTEVHARYAPRLLRYLLVAAHGDEQAAVEALQGAFVRAVRHARLFTTEEALWGWLTLLARHALADARRSTGRWRAFLARFAGASQASIPGQADSPDPLPALLESALADLSEADRSLLEQKYFAATSVRDLAASAGVSEKALESRLGRARQRLRELIIQRMRS